MVRGMIVALALTASAVSAAPASAQVFNPTLPSVPALPPPPTPPAATPGMEAPPPLIGSDSRSDQGAANPRIELGSPSRETFNDRAIRCNHAAQALGIRRSKQGQYVRECINSN